MKSETKPWGAYHIIDEGEGFKVKRIVVKPQGRLSLQSHQHRSEHWTVVKGVATVIVGDRRQELQAAQSVDIPKGARHRLENFHTEMLEIIEVQFGDILSEDDIIRYEDIYGRK